MILSIFSNACSLFVYYLWRNVYLPICPLSIFWSSFLYSGYTPTLLLTSANYFCRWLYLIHGDNWEGRVVPLGDVRSHMLRGHWFLLSLFLVLLLKSGEAVWGMRRSRNHMCGQEQGRRGHPNSLAGATLGVLVRNPKCGHEPCCFWMCCLR